LRNVGFGSAEIEEYPAAELKKAPSGIQRMPTAQTLFDYQLCASVRIAPEKRRYRRVSQAPLVDTGKTTTFPSVPCLK
jgi:hypothetical protein